MLRLLKNHLGFSMVETIVALGLAGGVSYGVMKLSTGAKTQTVYANQNFEMENYVKTLRTDLKDLNKCNNVLTESGGEVRVDLGAVQYEMKHNLQIDSAEAILPALDPGVRQVKPITIFVRFDRGMKGDLSRPTRKTIAMAQFTETGSFEGCANYETEAEKTAYRLSCELVGGTFREVAGDPPYDCDISGVSGNEDFYLDVKRHLCNTAFGGNGFFDEASGHCRRMNLGASALITGGNISPDQVGLRGQFRTTFVQNCPGTNNFVRSINTEGSVDCMRLKFCVPGANCPGDTTRVDGLCGSSHNQIFPSAPTSNLCSAGNATAVSGSGPFTWDCFGVAGGIDESCTASLENVQ